MGRKSSLTPKQQRFVDEYIIDLNASQAAIRAGYKGDANTIGPRLLANVGIQQAIAIAIQARSERMGISADDVLRKWWELANVDVNELVEYRRENCRKCWGDGHQYQWTETEYGVALALSQEKDEKPPSILGGFGFVQSRDPHPGCPECAGEGRGHIHVHDSRKLRGAARRLYAGVQQGKDGLKVLMEDRSKALENVARHLGMFNDKLALTLPNGVSVRHSAEAKPDELREALKGIIDEV